MSIPSSTSTTGVVAVNEPWLFEYIMVDNVLSTIVVPAECVEEKLRVEIPVTVA